jgi:hypothetical protein
MSDASGSDYSDGNVIRPKAFDSVGLPRGAGGLSGGHGGGSDMMLLARVAKLESDVEHIRRDVTSVQADLKTVLAGVADIRVNSATVVERTQHLATREWVMWRLLGAFLLLVAAFGAVVGYAPRLQSALGTSTVTSVPPR